MPDLQMKYDIHKHGVGIIVYDFKNDRYGTVKEIRETSYEYIEPFIDFGSGKLERAEPYNLLVVLNEKRNTDAKG